MTVEPPLRDVVVWRAFRLAGRYALLNALIAIPLHLLIDAAGFGATGKWQPGFGASVVLAVLLAPIIETALYFWLPIVLVRKVLGYRPLTPFVTWLACVGPFSFTHYGGSLGRSALTALCTGLVGGSCFYFCFLTAEKEAGLNPFWTTALCHAIFNGTVLTAFGVAYILGFVS